MLPPEEDPNPDHGVVSATEAAKWLGIGRSSMYVAIRDGQVPSIKIGRRVYVPTASLKRLMGEPIREDVADEAAASPSGLGAGLACPHCGAILLAVAALPKVQ
jgi:excisionase family DNA binding protein